MWNVTLSRSSDFNSRMCLSHHEPSTSTGIGSVLMYTTTQSLSQYHVESGVCNVPLNEVQLIGCQKTRARTLVLVAPFE